MYADVKAEDVECDMPSASSSKEEHEELRNHDGSRVKLYRGVFLPVNGPLTSAEKRQTALLYDDPCTGRSFRFLLHRKNARKADIYTCAKCKSRRKYVRIMVQNDKFLCDPASLDHICYMNPAELHEERIRLEQRKQRKRKKLPLDETAMDESLFDAEAFLYPEYQNLPPDEGLFINSTSNSPKSPLTEDTPQAIPLNELVNQSSSDSNTERRQHPSADVPTVSANQTLSRPKEELQASEQEPSEPQSNAMLRNEVCLESIKMALESIPPANRQKAHVDILRYVYTTIFDRYLL